MKKLILSIAVVLGAAFLGPPGGAEILSTEQALAERVMGDPDAPVTIIEYASLTCPHCASFHRDTLPKLKADWIDTGRAKLIYRDYPTSPAGPSFAASMISRCAPADNYFSFLDAFYKSQKTWVSSPNPFAAIAQIARLFGMSREDAEACLQNEDLLAGLRQVVIDGQTKYGIESTPSFVIGDQVIRGNVDYDEFQAALEKAAK